MFADCPFRHNSFLSSQLAPSADRPALFKHKITQHAVVLCNSRTDMFTSRSVSFVSRPSPPFVDQGPGPVGGASSRNLGIGGAARAGRTLAGVLKTPDEG